MELFFAGVFGLAIGVIAGLFARPATAVGRAFIPAVAGAVALGYWALATWLLRVPGFDWLSYDRAWIWVLLIVVVTATAFTLTFTLPRMRAAGDRELLDRLTHTGHAH